MRELRVDLGERGYNIYLGSGLLARAGELLRLDRRVLILTDEGVPVKYSEAVKAQCRDATVLTLPQGEGTKSLATLEKVLEKMVDMELTRRDCLVAVGGGVIGDLCGFAASCYMRGIDFYNIPTTLLSMVDSSIGGKTAVNLGGVKNVVGAFYQPSAVLIDTNTLATLDERQYSAGLCEAIKMSLTSDERLFCRFETVDYVSIKSGIEAYIANALDIKRRVVEQDEKEKGLRKILNFGHTVGHGIEAEQAGKLYHGECVALGMLPFCQGEVRERLIRVLEKVGLPIEYKGDLDKALAFVAHDKKRAGKLYDTIAVERVGDFVIRPLTIEEIKEASREAYN